MLKSVSSSSRRLRWWLAIGLAVVLSSGCGRPTAAEHLSRAESAYADGQWQAAVIELKNALSQDPNLAEARRLLGLVLLKVGDGPSAEKELRRAVDLGLPRENLLVALTRAALLQDKYQEIADDAVREAASGAVSAEPLSPADQAELGALRGLAYAGLGRVDTASDFFEQALAIDPSNAEAQLGKGLIAWRRGDAAAAREAVERLVKNQPGFGLGWSVFGDIERIEGNLDAAERAYTHAIKHQFFAPGDHLNRALVRISLGRYEDASEDASVLERRMPRAPAGPYVRGLIKLKQQDLAGAKTAFQAALKESPDYLPAVFYSGLLDAVQGRPESAEEKLARFLRAYPGSDDAARLLAAVRSQRGDHAGAEALLKPVLQRRPNDPVALQLLGEVALRRGRPQDSAEYFRKLVAEQAHSSQAFLRLGVSTLAAGDRAEAVKALEMAASLDTDNTRAEELLVATHLNAKNFDQAMAVAERVVAERPQDPLGPNLIAVTLLAKGDLAGALAAFERSLKLSPGYTPAAHNMARVLMAQGDNQRAREVLSQALDRQPDQVETILMLAALESRADNRDAAVAHLQSAIDRQPKVLAPRLVLSREYVRVGEPGKALALLKEVEAGNERNILWLMATGEAELAAGQPARAAQTFERATQVAPTSGGAHYMLGRALAESGDYGSAGGAMDRALALAPQSAPAAVAKVWLLLRQRKFGEASPRIAELRGRFPDSSEVLVLEAELAMAQGRPADAVRAYQAVRDRAPTSEWTVALARAQWLAGSQADAVKTLEEWVSQHPRDASARLSLAEAHTELKDANRAKAEYEAVLGFNPDNHAALNNLAMLVRNESPARAREYAEKAYALAPQSAAVLDTLGTLLLEQGEAARSVDLLRRAVDRSPRNPTIRFHLAEALAQGGDRDGAAAQLAEVLKDGASAFPERERALALRERLAKP